MLNSRGESGTRPACPTTHGDRKGKKQVDALLGRLDSAMSEFISNRAIRRLPLLFASALAGLFAAAMLIAGVRPTQAQPAATDISIVVSPPTLTADGVSTADITVTVYKNSIRNGI